jgi:hypothetical protein
MEQTLILCTKADDDTITLRFTLDPTNPRCARAINCIREFSRNHPVDLVRDMEFIVPVGCDLDQRRDRRVRLNLPDEAIYSIPGGLRGTGNRAGAPRRIYAGVHRARDIVWYSAIQIVFRMIHNVVEKPVGIKQT